MAEETEEVDETDEEDEDDEYEELEDVEAEFDVEVGPPVDEDDEIEVELDAGAVDVEVPVGDEVVVANDTNVAPWMLYACLYAVPTSFFI